MAVMKSGNSSSVYFTNASNSKNCVKRERLSFTNVDATLIVLSMVTFVAHLATDFFLVFSYYNAGHDFWAYSTVALVLVPAIIIQAFSIRWHIIDSSASICKWLCHFCLFGVFFRHIGALKTGLEARRSGDVADFQSLFHQQSDISMLQLFESFMKSAPQLVLQIYIMVQVKDWGAWTGLSAGASLVSLAWAMAAYTRAMRQARPEKQKASISGLLLQAVWRAGLLIARIAALVLFAVCCQAWLFLFLGLHWLGMTVWVVLQKTDLCSTPWEECAYNCVVGVVYCFCFFNLREGRARGRMLAFYVVTVTQNLGCLYVFLALAQHTHPTLATSAAGAVVGGTIIGLAAMLTYYRFFHPSGPITLFGPASSLSNSNPQMGLNNEVSSVQCVPQRPLHPILERSSQSQAQTASSESPQMPTDVEKSNSLRSLKHLWSVDRDGSVSSRSDDVPVNGGSPQHDDSCTDRRQLLSSKESTHLPVSVDIVQPLSEPTRHSNLTSISSQPVGMSQSTISSQSNILNVASRSTLNSHHVSPSSSHQVLSSQSLHASLSNPSVNSANTSHSTVSGHSIHSNYSSAVGRPNQVVRPSVNELSNIPNSGREFEDSQLSWNCTSMMDDTLPSEIIENPSPDFESCGKSALNKRRGICSSVELGLDKLANSQKDDDCASPVIMSKHSTNDLSFAALCQKLVANVEVKQIGSIESLRKDSEKNLKDISEKTEKLEKRESDYIDSKQSAISSDGTASEVLSAHDYENICAVNIAREAWGLRSWQGYSDIETWLHDDSVVRDRRRDTLASINTTTTLTSASSERSSESPPLLRQHWDKGSTPAPPLPCRRPRPSYNRMDDYLDTLTFDLTDIEEGRVESNDIEPSEDQSLFLAQPYLVGQNGMLYPLSSSLDTILEEIDDSSISNCTVTTVEDGLTVPLTASSLVATIDEIRMDSCEGSGTVSKSNFKIGSCQSLQFDSSMINNFPCQERKNGNVRDQLRFAHSLPSLLQAPRSWSHLTPEEVLFLSALRPQQDIGFSREFKCPTSKTHQEEENQNSKRLRRKFSLLREKFEVKCEGSSHGKPQTLQNGTAHPINCDKRKEENIKNTESFEQTSRFANSPSHLNDESTKSSAPLKGELLCIKSESSQGLSLFKETDFKGSGWSENAKSFPLKRQKIHHVMVPPELVPQSKKEVRDSNASA